jgi:hypothetical protein
LQNAEYRERRRKGLNRFFDLVRLGRALCKEARIEPGTNLTVLAEVAKIFIKETGVEL